jgi:hypothetical protein
MLVNASRDYRKKEKMFNVGWIDRASGSSGNTSRRYNVVTATPLSTSSFSVDEILII